MPEHQQIHQSKKSDTIFQKQTPSPKQIPLSNPMAIIQRAKINPKSLTHADVMQLQRTIGNRAVGRLLSEIGLVPSTAKPVQRQEIPEEEETCPSCVQRQEILKEEEPLQGKMIEPIQRQEIPEEDEPLQGKMVETIQRQEIPEEEEPLQGKFTGIVQRQELPDEEEPLQTKRENNTGMPDNLKAGVESFSGIDMSDVRVHYNSSKPAEVGALAYTQGTDIHVDSGQEKHLPHEAWHVVQQKQGRVQPMMQMKGLGINDDPSLEHEADMMGAKTAQFVPSLDEEMLQGNLGEGVAQKAEKAPNNMGMPDNFKAGIENLSGMSMDGVKVHYNSEKPAALNALSYVQGTDIHAGAGQEANLSHEAWNVMQQRLYIQKRTIPHGHDEASVVQKVGRKRTMWNDVAIRMSAAPANGEDRHSDDAEWLAMERYAINVPVAFKQTHTVDDVLREAEKIKLVSFDQWRVGLEAQHLVPHSEAIEFGWPYSQINCADNGKMLLAGRGNPIPLSIEHRIAKRLRNQTWKNAARKSWTHGTIGGLGYWGRPAKGTRHIQPRGQIAHPAYNLKVNHLLRKYYEENGLTIGQPLPPHQLHHYSKIKESLRRWHKARDRTSDTRSVDELIVDGYKGMTF